MNSEPSFYLNIVFPSSWFGVLLLLVVLFETGFFYRVLAVLEDQADLDSHCSSCLCLLVAEIKVHHHWQHWVHFLLSIKMHILKHSNKAIHVSVILPTKTRYDSQQNGRKSKDSFLESFPTWEAEYRQGSRKEPIHGAGCFVQCQSTCLECTRPQVLFPAS